MDREKVHASALHSRDLDASLLQPLCQGLQTVGKCLERARLALIALARATTNRGHDAVAVYVKTRGAFNQLLHLRPPRRIGMARASWNVLLSVLGLGPRQHFGVRRAGPLTVQRGVDLQERDRALHPAHLVCTSPCRFHPPGVEALAPPWTTVQKLIAADCCTIRRLESRRWQRPQRGPRNDLVAVETDRFKRAAPTATRSPTSCRRCSSSPGLRRPLFCDPLSVVRVTHPIARVGARKWPDRDPPGDANRRRVVARRRASREGGRGH